MFRDKATFTNVLVNFLFEFFNFVFLHYSFKGFRFVPPWNDPEFIVIYDKNGFIAGMQSIVTKVRNIWSFSPLVPSKREKNILVFLSLYIFWGICVYFSIFEWQNLQLCQIIHNYRFHHSKIWKINHFPQNWEKLSSLNSLNERT